MWCETSEGGPELGIHLGMGGRIVVTAADGQVAWGGEPFRRDAQPPRAEWDRFTLTFADGGRLALFDKRRLGRIRLDAALGAALDSAITKGGVHTGEVIAARHPGGTCPRCGAEMRHGTVGGRSTWWCSREQVTLAFGPHDEETDLQGEPVP